MKKGALIALMLIVAAPTEAQTPLDQAKQKLGNAMRNKAMQASIITQMERADRYYWLAFNVSICQLRSETWFSVIQTSWGLWRDQKIQEAGITYKQANERSARVRTEVENLLGPFPSSCKGLRNSPVMDELDAMESRATGNYH